MGIRKISLVESEICIRPSSEACEFTNCLCCARGERLVGARGGSGGTGQQAWAHPTAPSVWAMKRDRVA